MGKRFREVAINWVRRELGRERQESSTGKLVKTQARQLLTFHGNHSFSLHANIKKAGIVVIYPVYSALNNINLWI